MIVVAEVAEYTLRILGGVGDFFAELVPLAELLPDNLDDVVGVAVRFCENQSFGDFLAPGNSVVNRLSRKVRITMRIWLGLTMSRSNWVGW